MPDQPIEDPRIWELMEACRPGSGDLEDPALAPLAEQLAADPELAELFERLQRLDRALAASVRDLPVPEGLDDRITTRLAAVRNGQKAAAEDQPARQPEAREPAPEAAKPRRRLTRRRLLAGGAVAAVAASLALAIVRIDWGPPVFELKPVLDAARLAFENDRGSQGELLVQSEPPDDYPPSPDLGLSRFREIRWRWIEGFLDCKGVAYDLNLNRAGAPCATLYVVRGVVPDLDTMPPLKPQSTTGGQSVGAWQSGELIYVLVVQGGPRAYQGFLPSPTLA